MTVFLYTIIVLGAISFSAGVFLAFAAKKFEVKEDPLVKEVTAALPGANCGACGFPGCEGFAKEIIKGAAKADGCVPGRKSGIPEKIKAILENRPK